MLITVNDTDFKCASFIDFLKEVTLIFFRIVIIEFTNEVLVFYSSSFDIKLLFIINEHVANIIENTSIFNGRGIILH